MTRSTGSSARNFHGISLYGEVAEFTLDDVIQTIEFDSAKTLSKTDVEAVRVYLNITNEHVNEMTDRVLTWRRMQDIKDIFTAVFDVVLPSGDKVSFSMKQYLAATQASLPNYPFDGDSVREVHKSLLNNNQHRVLVYEAIKSHLSRYN